jgi:hypothetical protein
MEQLTVTPATATPHVVVSFRFQGSGWPPDGQLIIGFEGWNSAQVANVLPDGTFDQTWDQEIYGDHGNAWAFANVTATDYQHQERVRVPIG